MVKFTRMYTIRFWHFLPLFLVAGAFFITAAVAITKDCVIVDDNYKGKYIKVKYYEPFNKDSSYKCYYKPKELTIKIVGKHKKHVNFLRNGEELTAHGDKYKIKNLKKGQTIKVIEYFYPYHEFKIKEKH